MIDFKKIFKEFSALESLESNDNTYNVISIPTMLHKIGVSNENFPIFFISTNESFDNPPNIIRELLSVEYNVKCTIKEFNREILFNNFSIITLRTSDKQLQLYFIEIFLMLLTKMSQQPSMQELSIEVERLISIFSALKSSPQKKIQGLWAELLIIEKSKNPNTLINAWHNSVSSKYDFTLGRDKIEVKSTSSEERNHRFSLDQLNPSPNSRLLIASVIVRDSGECTQGLSIKDLYDTICNRLSDINTKIKLYTIIAQTLGKDIDKIRNEYFDYIAASDSLSYYDYKIIPKILKTNIPDNISNVKFSCNITNLEDIKSSNFDFSDSELFNSLF